MKRGFIVAGVVAAALVAVLVARRPATTSPAPAAAAAATSPEQRLAGVERVVAERNRNLGEESQRFIDDGWAMVQAEPPDPRLIDFDPALIAAGREPELRVQIASTVAAPRHARHLAEILLTAKMPATRESATEALGRINSDEAKNQLIDVLTSGKLDPDDLGRRQIAAHLRPKDLDDPMAAKIANLIDSPALTAAEKQQIAYNIALVGLRDGMTLSQPVLATLSPAARALIEQMTALGSKAFLAHTERR